jgi:hypothetical protein
MSSSIVAPAANTASVDTWRRLSRAGDKCGTHWRHVSGWELRHCGHPTAIWPYYLVDPARPDFLTVSFNGRGFKSLAIAQDLIESIVAGRIEVTVTDCEPGIARALVTTRGEGLASE